MTRRYTFTEEEKKQVEQAVKELETVSCGEIVPYFVSNSDEYREASWYTSTALGAFSCVIIGFLSYAWLLPFRITPLEVVVSILSAMIIGFVIPLLIPQAKRWIISRELQYERVFTRAKDAFLDEKVFETEERVGILIFISRLEHRVLVLGDEGISKKLNQEDWQHVVDEVVKGIKDNKIGEGLVRAIELCKDLLIDNGFVRKSTDTNELDDSLRIED